MVFSNCLVLCSMYLDMCVRVNVERPLDPCTCAYMHIVLVLPFSFLLLGSSSTAATTFVCQFPSSPCPFPTLFRVSESFPVKNTYRHNASYFTVHVGMLRSPLSRELLTSAASPPVHLLTCTAKKVCGRKLSDERAGAKPSLTKLKFKKTREQGWSSSLLFCPCLFRTFT